MAWRLANTNFSRLSSDVLHLRSGRPNTSVFVPMMHIWIVRVRMHLWFVVMFVRVRLAAIPLKIMLVLMMRIVSVRMRVRRRFVRVFVLMPLGKMQPHAARHQRCGQPECER